MVLFPCDPDTPHLEKSQGVICEPAIAEKILPRRLLSSANSCNQALSLKP